jgi:hypothetical protein
MVVSPALFEVAFLLGTAALALWFDARFPSLAPSDLRRALILTGAALVASHAVFMPAFDATVQRGQVLLAIFALALPCLWYVLLSTIWSIRLLQASLRGAR